MAKKSQPIKPFCCRAADTVEHAEGDLLQRHVEERTLGCKIVDLQFEVPKCALALGGVFFKSSQGTVLCDIDADSILAGVRLLPGMCAILDASHSHYMVVLLCCVLVNCRKTSASKGCTRGFC